MKAMERIGKHSNSVLDGGEVSFLLRPNGFLVRTYEQGGDFVQNIDCFASGFLLCFRVAGRISCGIRRHF
jgi:hypothetical protein